MEQSGAESEAWMDETSRLLGECINRTVLNPEYINEEWGTKGRSLRFKNDDLVLKSPGGFQFEDKKTISLCGETVGSLSYDHQYRFL